MKIESKPVRINDSYWSCCRRSFDIIGLLAASYSNPYQRHTILCMAMAGRKMVR